jgi:hypothetical protein
VGTTNDISGADAGVFFGPVIVQGGFTVLGAPKVPRCRTLMVRRAVCTASRARRVSSRTSARVNWNPGRLTSRSIPHSPPSR